LPSKGLLNAPSGPARKVWAWRRGVNDHRNSGSVVTLVATVACKYVEVDRPHRLVMSGRAVNDEPGWSEQLDKLERLRTDLPRESACV
jgi:uncharacterized protein YndB with AHSA1/START domain